MRARSTGRAIGFATTLTAKGQVTIPKRIRDALHLAPSAQVEFSVNDAGDVVLRAFDRFDAVHGGAEVKWRTDELMRLLRAGLIRPRRPARP